MLRNHAGTTQRVGNLLVNSLKQVVNTSNWQNEQHIAIWRPEIPFVTVSVPSS